MWSRTFARGRRLADSRFFTSSNFLVSPAFSCFSFFPFCVDLYHYNNTPINVALWGTGATLLICPSLSVFLFCSFWFVQVSIWFNSKRIILHRWNQWLSFLYSIRHTRSMWLVYNCLVNPSSAVASSQSNYREFLSRNESIYSYRESISTSGYWIRLQTPQVHNSLHQLSEKLWTNKFGNRIQSRQIYVF